MLNYDETYQIEKTRHPNYKLRSDKIQKQVNKEEELLITRVGRSISWVYPTEVVKECIARPSKVSLSDDHHFEVLALKSPITIEEARFKSLKLDKNKFRLEQNVRM